MRVFANYVIEREVGEGGYGKVSLAKNPISSDVKVVKTLQNKYKENPAVVDMFVREAKIMAQLNHPNIAPIYNVGLEPEPYLITDYYGKSLAAKLEEGRLEVREAIEIQKQLLKALNHAHTHKLKVVHRDIKPENIMFNNGSIKLTDFGIALVMQQSNEFRNLAQQLTGCVVPSRKEDKSLDSIVMTFNYASPEVRRGEKATPQSDIYSAGKVFYKMLTGEEQEGLTLPSEINPNVPYELDIIVKKGIDPDLRRRYRSAQQMLNDLERLHIKSLREKIGDFGKVVGNRFSAFFKTGKNAANNTYNFFYNDIVHGDKRRTKWIGEGLLALVIAYGGFTYSSGWLRARPQAEITPKNEVITITPADRLAEYQQRFKNIKGLVIEQEYDLARGMINTLEEDLNKEKGEKEKRLLKDLRVYLLNTKGFYIKDILNPFSIYHGVFVENLNNGKGDKRISDKYDYSLTWSPDGRHMLLAGYNPAVTDSNGANLQNLRNSKGDITGIRGAFWIDKDIVGFDDGENNFYCVDIDQFNNSHRFRRFDPERIPEPIKSIYYDYSLIELLHRKR